MQSVGEYCNIGKVCYIRFMGIQRCSFNCYKTEVLNAHYPIHRAHLEYAQAYLSEATMLTIDPIIGIVALALFIFTQSGLQI